MKKEINMTLQLSSASAQVQAGWSNAVQVGVQGPVPAFQPAMVSQVLPAISLRQDWLDEEYREAYLEASIEQNIAWQIKFNRQSRNLDQRQLAELTGTQQSAISRIEDPSYGRLNLKSIVKIAHAFKCALTIKLIPYSELAEQTQSFNKESLIVKSFEEEIQLIYGENI